MSVNKVILVGNLGKDPEVRYTQNQVAVGNFTLATSDRRKDASGNWTDHTEWHNVRVFGKSAENCGKYLKKGRQVYVEGRLQTRKWQDKEGKDRYTTEIIADTVQFLGSKGGSEGPRAEQSSNFSNEEVSAGKDFVNSLPSADSMSGGGSSETSGDVPFDDDDIPF